jgi:AraC family transcriptional regulator of arabinose operon
MCVLLSEIDHVSAGEVTYPPGGRLGPRWQHDVELVLVHSGSARVFVDDAPAIDLRAESAGLLLPGHRERFEFADDVPTHHSWVQARLTEPSADLIDRLAGLPRSLAASTPLTELVREAADVSRTPLSTAEPLLAALAAAAIWRYAGDAESRGRGPTDVVGRARRHLHLQLADPELDLARVAASAHVTPAHLVRRFRAELGITPMAYLWQRRVATGIDLLTNTGLPVGQVATRSGFRSVYHFSRRVKEHTGVPPTELRRERWSQSKGPRESC